MRQTDHGQIAHSHVNRLRKTSNTALETLEHTEGMFPDSRRLLGRSSGTKDDQGTSFIESSTRDARDMC